LLLSIIEIDNEYAEAHASLGELYLGSGNVDRAKESFELALSFDSGNLVAHMGYGNILLQTDDPGSAIDHFDIVIEQAPDYVFAHVDRSRAKEGIGDLFGAEADLSEAVRLDPDYYWHYIDRGRLRLFSLNNPESALQDFDRAVQIDPDFFYAYIFRGTILDRAGENARAIEDYLKVFEARPDYRDLYAPAGVLLYAEERFQLARKYLGLAYKHAPDEHFFAYLIALSFRKESRNREAKEFVNQAIEKIPQESLYYRLARIILESGADGYIAGEISREEDVDVKLKALFVMGTYYLLHERPILAQKYFLEVEDNAPPLSYERRLATLELERYREGSEG
jgi:tetratricopeptide (TPR) repeat protein